MSLGVSLSAPELVRRRPVWVALSELYLDTELPDFTHRHIAQVLLTSGYSWPELRRIDREEVFPVLYPNLLSVAGEWALFEEEWLVPAIQAALARRTRLSSVFLRWLYARLRRLTAADWQAIARVWTRGGGELPDRAAG